jgi:hypothetical protein
MDHQTASSILGSRDSRNMPGKATQLTRLAGNVIALRLYSTDILKWPKPEPGAPNIVILNARSPAGQSWRSVLTKTRLNTYLNAWRVYQHDREWFIWRPDAPNDDPIPFADGMILID